MIFSPHDGQRERPWPKNLCRIAQACCWYTKIMYSTFWYVLHALVCIGMFWKVICASTDTYSLLLDNINTCTYASDLSKHTNTYQYMLCIPKITINNFGCISRYLSVCACIGMYFNFANTSVYWEALVYMVCIACICIFSLVLVCIEKMVCIVHCGMYWYIY